MDADNFIEKGNAVRAWFLSPTQDPWKKTCHYTKLVASGKFDSQNSKSGEFFPRYRKIDPLESSKPSPDYRKFHTFLTYWKQIFHLKENHKTENDFN